MPIDSNAILFTLSVIWIGFIVIAIVIPAAHKWLEKRKDRRDRNEANRRGANGHSTVKSPDPVDKAIATFGNGLNTIDGLIDRLATAAGIVTDRGTIVERQCLTCEHMSYPVRFASPCNGCVLEDVSGSNWEDAGDSCISDEDADVIAESGDKTPEQLAKELELDGDGDIDRIRAFQCLQAAEKVGRWIGHGTGKEG